MKWRHWHRHALAAGMCLLGVAATAPNLAALRGLEAGQWELREASGAHNRLLCLGDRGALIQLRHRGAQCTQLVLESAATQATVHYSCPGTGYGRTVITVETPRLVHIQTQGMAEGLPFSLDYEGRRTGPCSAATR